MAHNFTHIIVSHAEHNDTVCSNRHTYVKHNGIHYTIVLDDYRCRLALLANKSKHVSWYEYHYNV